MTTSQEIFQNRNENELNDISSNDVQKPTNYLSDEQLEVLKQLCRDLNPYEEMSLDEKLKLQEFNITDLNNPFAITNKLLMILEDNLQYRESLNQNS